MITCKFDPSLPPRLKKYFDDPNKLQKSIAVSARPNPAAPSHRLANSNTHPSDIYDGWGEARGSADWPTRWKAWHTKAVQIDLGRISGAPIYFLIGKEVIKAHELSYHERFRGIDKASCAIPIFTSLLEKDPADDWAVRNIAGNSESVDDYSLPTNLGQELVIESGYRHLLDGAFKAAATERFNASIENKSNQPKEETNKMKQLFDKVLNQNKDAVALAGKLSVGKAGNSFLLSQVTGKFPWYARLFGAKAKVQDNPLAKLAAAQVANALAVHFAPTNKKIAYVADAMLQEAMVDLITNSNQLQSLIEQLEGFAGTIVDEVK